MRRGLGLASTSEFGHLPDPAPRTRHPWMIRGLVSPRTDRGHPDCGGVYASMTEHRLLTAKPQLVWVAGQPRDTRGSQARKPPFPVRQRVEEEATTRQGIKSLAWPLKPICPKYIAAGSGCRDDSGEEEALHRCPGGDLTLEGNRVSEPDCARRTDKAAVPVCGSAARPRPVKTTGRSIGMKR